MEIGGEDILFGYGGNYAQFVKDVLGVCLHHWPKMVVEFDDDQTFYVYRSRESFLRWEGGDEMVQFWKGSEEGPYHGDERMICFILSDSAHYQGATAVVDENWESEKTIVAIMDEVKKLWVVGKWPT